GGGELDAADRGETGDHPRESHRTVGEQRGPLTETVQVVDLCPGLGSGCRDDDPENNQTRHQEREDEPSHQTPAGAGGNFESQGASKYTRLPGVRQLGRPTGRGGGSGWARGDLNPHDLAITGT